MSALKSLQSYTKGEQDFIVEMTKRMLVKWCDHQLHYGEMPEGKGTGKGDLYLQVAREKGWVSKKADVVLGTGFKVAAAFLRR